MHAHGCFCVGSLLGKHGILSFDLRLAANPFDLSAPRCPTRSAKRTSVLGYSWFSFEGGSIGSKAAHSQSSRANLRGTSSGGTSQQRHTSGARQYDSCTIGAHTIHMSDSETPLGRGAGGAHSSKKKKKAQQAALAAQQAAKAMQRAQFAQAQAAAQSQQQQTRGAGVTVKATHQLASADAMPQPHSSVVGPAAAVDDDQPDVEQDQLEAELEENPQQLHPEESEEEELDISVAASSMSMQALLVHLLQQQKKAKAAAKAARAQDHALIVQLQTQLQQQASSAVRLGTTLSTGALAPASRSTLKVEAGVAAQQQALAAATAPNLQQQQQALIAAAAARSPGAPGVHAAALAAPPRRELPKVKQELEAAALSKDPTLLKSWVFQMERLLRALELSSAQEFTFGDRLSVAQDHWDAGIDAWWNSLCDARAATMQPAVCSWAGLIAALHETYAPVSDGMAAAREMHQIKQGASESMESYVRRVLELQGRIPPGRLPSHVIGDLALNGVDESRFPWTLSIVRGEATVFANSQSTGQGPDMSFVAHRLRTQAGSEPKVARGAGGSSSELSAIKAELAKLQHQLTQNSHVAHTAAISTAQSTESHSSGRKSGGKPGDAHKMRGGRPGGGQRKKLEDGELKRRYEAGLCFECNKPGHIGRDCPERAARKQQQQAEGHGAEGAPSSGN